MPFARTADPDHVATDKVAGKLSSTLSWVKNSVSQMASTVAPPTTLQTTSSTSLSSAGLSPPSSTQLSPDDVELLAKLEEQNSTGQCALAVGMETGGLVQNRDWPVTLASLRDVTGPASALSALFSEIRCRGFCVSDTEESLAPHEETGPVYTRPPLAPV
ncbi:hypothetical protein CRUP_015601 [Coryphaenoides rupestris]|nr:hypothetical protein CRUP_015601 [Coryphaenoides rupestris]